MDIFKLNTYKTVVNAVADVNRGKWSDARKIGFRKTVNGNYSVTYEGDIIAVFINKECIDEEECKLIGWKIEPYVKSKPISDENCIDFDC